MEITFDKEYLRQLYKTGVTKEKNHRFQPQIAAKFRKTVDLLQSVSSTEELYLFNSLHYQVLKGDKKGIESVRLNDQYRLEFTTQQVVSETIITVCNIVDLSNHYK